MVLSEPTTARGVTHQWPDNCPIEVLTTLTTEALSLTFGFPPCQGGPYAEFERRCLAEYESLTAVLLESNDDT